MDERLFSVDPLSGSQQWFSYDEDKEMAIIRRVCDVQPVIDQNKDLAHQGTWRNKTPGDLDMRLAASIPLDLAYKWLIEKGVCCWRHEHWEATKALLNSNEYRDLRPNTGKTVIL